MQRQHPQLQVTQSDTLQEITVPFVPRKVDLRHLDEKGNLLTEHDIKFLQEKNIQAMDKNVIFGKGEITREQVSRRPAIVNNALYGIYTGDKALGKGAFGKAVLAQQHSSQTNAPSQWTVLKVMPAKKNLLSAVQSEALALNEASDAFIGTCEKQGGVGAKKHYIMMTLAKGLPLSKLLEGDSKIDFSVMRRMDMAMQLIAVINAVHQKGYLHRDIKPGNFNYDPITNRVEVLDFGLSVRKGKDGTARFTGTDFAPGTLLFMAEEIALPNQFDSEEKQKSNESIYNEATDVFALGRTLKILFGYEYTTWMLKDKKPELLEKDTVLDAFLNRMDNVDPKVRPTLTEAATFFRQHLVDMIPSHSETIGIVNLHEYESAGPEKRAKMRAGLQKMSEVALIDAETTHRTDILDKRRVSLIREFEDANIVINPKILLARHPEMAIQHIHRDYAQLQAVGGKIATIKSFVSPNRKLEQVTASSQSSTANLLMAVGSSTAGTIKKQQMFKIPRYTIPSITTVQSLAYKAPNTAEAEATPLSKRGITR